MALLVVLFVVAGGVSAPYVRARAEADAERAAEEDAVIAQERVPTGEVRLLDKPFTRDALLRSVQEALGSKR